MNQKNSPPKPYLERIFTYFIISMGLFLLWHFLFPLPHFPVQDLLFLTALNFLFSLLGIILPSGVHLNLAYPITMGTFFLFGPAFTMVTMVPGVIAGGLKRGRGWDIILFNIGQLFLSIWFTNLVFNAMGGYGEQIRLEEDLPTLLLALLTMSLINSLLVCLALNLEGKTPFWPAFQAALISDVFKISPLYYTIGLILTIVYENQGLPGGFLVSLPLISIFFILRDQKVIKETHTEVYTDPLTGLKNRRYLDHWLEDHLPEYVETGKLVVLLLDIDNFKTFNDTCGHQKGDKALQSIARILEDSVGETDIVIRYGGEEFVVLLPHTQKKRGQRTAETIRKNIAQWEPSFECPPVTVSIGLSSLDQNPDMQTGWELIRQADKATYLAKYQGKNQVCTFQKVRALKGAEA